MFITDYLEENKEQKVEAELWINLMTSLSREQLDFVYTRLSERNLSYGEKLSDFEPGTYRGSKEQARLDLIIGRAYDHVLNKELGGRVSSLSANLFSKKFNTKESFYWSSDYMHTSLIKEKSNNFSVTADCGEQGRVYVTYTYLGNRFVDPFSYDAKKELLKVESASYDAKGNGSKGTWVEKGKIFTLGDLNEAQKNSNIWKPNIN